ncbi:MAG: helix-hairpin-helix domain-containing protein [Burkholderiaceae bacterium]
MGRSTTLPARFIKAPKAASASECHALEQLPNVGPAMAGDLRLLGLNHPADLRGRDAYALYRALERATGQRQDPCVLDTFMAIVDFMNGAAPKPWWAYTAERKQLHGQVRHEQVRA